mgnify:CR=1 FL=1
MSRGRNSPAWTVPAFTVHRLPDGVDLRTAALTEPLAVACHDVRLGAVAPGELAVVIGGGLLGLEAANGLMKRGMQVTVVHVSEWLMERQLDDVDQRVQEAIRDGVLLNGRL